MNQRMVGWKHYNSIGSLGYRLVLIAKASHHRASQQIYWILGGNGSCHGNHLTNLGTYRYSDSNRMLYLTNNADIFVIYRMSFKNSSVDIVHSLYIKYCHPLLYRKSTWANLAAGSLIYEYHLISHRVCPRQLVDRHLRVFIYIYI